MNKNSLIPLGLCVACVFGSGAAWGYRTAEDAPDFEGAGVVRWNQESVAFSMYSTLPHGMSWELVKSEIEAGFNVWGTANCGQPWMRIEGPAAEPAIPNDGINTVEWVLEGWDDRGFSARAAAITDVQYQETEDGGWEIVEVDLYFNAESFAWTTDPEPGDSEKDIQVAATHEAGHVLGLLHPCEPNGSDDAPSCDEDQSYQQAIMYPEYTLGRSALGTDDIQGVCHLYSTEACPEDGCPRDTICTASGCLPVCGDLVCNSGYLCVEGACIEDRRAELATCDSIDPSDDDYCEKGEGLVADPCDSDADCAPTLRCSVDGYCGVACSSGVTCLESQECPLTGVCPLEGAGFEQSCEKAQDCDSRICVDREGKGAVCTRSCAREDSHCPSGWECRDVDEEGPICAPIINDSSCSTSREPATHQPLYWLVTAGLCGCIGCRKLRHRRAVRPSQHSSTRTTNR